MVKCSARVITGQSQTSIYLNHVIKRLVMNSNTILVPFQEMCQTLKFIPCVSPFLVITSDLRFTQLFIFVVDVNIVLHYIEYKTCSSILKKVIHLVSLHQVTSICKVFSLLYKTNRWFHAIYICLVC